MVNKNSQLGDRETKHIIKDCLMNKTEQESLKETSRNHGQGLQLNQADHLVRLNQQTNEESQKHIAGLETQLDQAKSDVSESKETVLETKHQFTKLELAQTDKQEHRSEVAEKGNQTKEMEHIKNTFIMVKESNNNLNSDISEHKFKCNKQEAEMKAEEQSKGDKHEFIDELKPEIMKLKAENTELNTKYYA